MNETNELTRILDAASRGDPRAASALLPAVYDELRRLAARRIAEERPGQTLQATALVHEAYLKVAGQDQPRWESRAHFFAAAAQAMRQILIDAARRKRAARHGGEHQRVDLDESLLQLARSAGGADDLLALDEALTRFEAEDATKAKLVKLRFFAGLSIEEAAAAMGISRATASRYWEYARAWLRDAMGANPPQGRVPNSPR
jgi:RNA polymerase sigma factor (TIGR02999 family)